MRKTIALGSFAALAAGSAGAGALDSVPNMLGSDTLKNITTAVVDACTDLGTYPTDGDPLKPGNQPIVYDGTGSSNGETGLKSAVTTQWVAPMSRALGTGICDSAAPRTGAEGLVFALDGLSVVFGGGQTGPAQGIDILADAGTWKSVLRRVYTGMGPTGNNTFTRDCNSAARRDLVNNWDALFAGAATGTTCSDSNPDSSVTEAGLRHAFRRDEESGTTDVFLAQLSLPSVNFQQVTTTSSVIPAGSSATQAAVFRALAHSPFCNSYRPDDDYLPTSKGTSQIPAMVSVGVPAPVVGLGLAPFASADDTSPRAMSPYMPEMMDQDPIRRRCFGSKVALIDSPNGPREEVCSADGALGLVLPINPPTDITTAQRYPSIPCEDTRDFEFGPAAKRVNGDPVRCPNGDAPQDSKCLLPTRTEASAPGGFAFDCLNNGLNAPAAIFDADGNGSVYPDAPNTDGRGDADGRAYNLILRATDGTIRLQKRPNPSALGTMNVPIVGAFYRLHSSRSGLASPNHTVACATQDDATDQIGCLVQKNLCSMGFAGGGAVTNNPGTASIPPVVAALVNNVAPTTANVQALVTGGTTYPIARKLYVNTLRGFENLLTSSDPALPVNKDAELDLIQCFSNVPFSTFATVSTLAAPLNVASAAFGFVPLPAPTTGGNATALCEDVPEALCTAGAAAVDACVGNPAQVPSSSCTNGYKDGKETGVDVCPAAGVCNAAGNCP